MAPAHGVRDDLMDVGLTIHQERACAQDYRAGNAKYSVGVGGFPIRRSSLGLLNSF